MCCEEEARFIYIKESGALLFKKTGGLSICYFKTGESNWTEKLQKERPPLTQEMLDAYNRKR